MKKVSKKLIVVLAIVIILLCLSTFAFLNAGSWLKGNDKPVQSQAIIILSGPPTRSFYAADLYAQGFAKEIYVSRPVREYPLKMLDDLGVYVPRAEDIYKQVLIRKGVPDKDIHIFGESLLSTVQEAEAASKIFSGDKCKVLIVTSPFHVKRTQMIFKEKLRNCEFTVVGTPYEPYPDKWWSNQDSARNIILEITKIIFYKFGGRFYSGVDESSRYNARQ
jgi:uncharacterized SAM-binding protein YcdF (DUF218 family)